MKPVTRIFYIEDDPKDVLAFVHHFHFKRALRGQRSEVILQFTGVNAILEARKLIREHIEIDVLVLDINLQLEKPVMDGSVLAESFRREPDFAHIPLILYSNYVDGDKPRSVSPKSRLPGVKPIWELNKTSGLDFLGDLICTLLTP